MAIGGYVFCVVLAITPFTMDPAGDIKRLLLGLFAAGLGLAWLAVTWARRLPVRRPPILLELLGGLLLLYVLSAFRTPYYGYSLTEVSYFFSLFLLYLVSSQVYVNSRHVRGLFLFLCAGVALAAAYALLIQKTGLDPFPWGDRGEDIYTNLPGTFGNPNYAAHTLILAMAASVWLATHRSLRWTAALTVLFAVWLLFTEQRGGWMGLGAGLALAGLGGAAKLAFRRPAARAAAAILATALLGLGGAGAYLAWNHADHGIALPLDGSLLLRYNGYLSASEMAMEHPVLGHGPGVYQLKNPEYWTPFEQQWFAQELRFNSHVHNDLLEIAVDAGLLAAGLYLMALVLGMGFSLVMAHSAENASRRRLGYALAVFFAAFLVDGLFGFNLRVPVSASLLFLAFGVLDGLWAADAAPAPARAPRPAWRLALCACALFLVFWHVRVFASEVWFHQGMRAHHRVLALVNTGLEQRREMDPERTAAFLDQQARDAIAAFAQGRWLAPWNFQFAARTGETHMAMQRAPEAVEAFRAALADNPYYIPTMTRLGNALVAWADTALAGNENAPEDPIAVLDEAEEIARKAAAMCPVLPRAEDLLGRIALSRARHLAHADPAGDESRIRGAWRDAEAHFERAIQLGARRHVELFRLLAHVRRQGGDEAGEVDALVRAAQADLRDETVWEPFFALLRRPGHDERLRATLYRMIAAIQEMDPPREHAIAHGFLALADDFAEEGALDRADRAFLDSVSHGGDLPRVWAEFGQYAQKNGRVDVFSEALRAASAEALAEGHRAHPALAVGFLVLGEIEERHREDSAAALEAYRLAARFGPARPDVWAQFAGFASRTGHLDAFKEALVENTALCLEHGPVPLVHVRAVYDVLENGPAALDNASRAVLRQFREYPQGNARLAALHLGWAVRLMLESASQAQQAEAPICLAYLNLGIVLNGLQQYELAGQLFPFAVQCLEGEDQALAGTHWAQTMLALNRIVEALNLLEDLRRRFPDNPDLRLVHAQALARTNRIPEAVREYDALLEMEDLPPAARQQLESERDQLF